MSQRDVIQPRVPASAGRRSVGHEIPGRMDNRVRPWLLTPHMQCSVNSFGGTRLVHKRRVVEVATDPEILFNTVVSPEDSGSRVLQDRQVSYLTQLMSDHLEPREQEIVDSRFGRYPLG